MTKFRKLPVEVEAEPYIAEAQEPEGLCWELTHGANCPHVHTLNGPVVVMDGDWIVTGIKGERYPCAPEIFAETYELVIDPVDPPEFRTTIDPAEVRKPPKGPKLW